VASVSHSVAFHTLGCKTNQLETSAMAEQFRHAGWHVVGFEDAAASLVVINSCTVTERADRDTQRVIRRAKLNNPAAKVAVTGCYAQVAPVEVSTLPGVDYVIGNADKGCIPDIIATHGDLTQPLIQVSDWDKSRVMAAGMEGGLDRTRASLKIQDGCDYKCTYCIIWEARGPSRCLPVADLVANLQQLVADGFHEVVLTGINIGQYRDVDGTDLADLLSALLAVCGNTRLRLSSLDPLEVDDPLIQVIANSDGRICPHVHLSAQSACNTVLKRMARRHHVADFQRICDTLKAQVPGISIGSDIIVGFPGETDAEYAETRTVLAHTPIDYFHVFSYSRRTGTPAATMPNQVPQRVIQQRSRDLAALSDTKWLAYRHQQHSAAQDVIVEHDGCKGMSQSYIRVQLEPHLPALAHNSRIRAMISRIEGNTTWVTV
jgi:threonylcarbamoyladenosine tRNA methylthiotransferase MtaB